MSMHIVFFGPEGSGKGTQAILVSEKLGIPHLVSGNLVRKYASEDPGIMGRICKEALVKGHYVADSEMYVLWKQRFKEEDTKNGWVLDGFPRNLTQAKFLVRKVEKYEQEIDLVIFLNVSEKESIRRLTKRKRKNPDGTLHDSLERINERLKHYNRGKNAVLRYYQEREILFEVNGESSVETIHKNIMRKLDGIKEKKLSDKQDIENKK
jgi:adenylate kinase